MIGAAIFGRCLLGCRSVAVGSYTAFVSYTGDASSGTLIGGNDVVLYGFATTAVPEPASVLAAASAALGLAGRVRRRRSAGAAA